MVARKSQAKPDVESSGTDPAVVAFLKALDYPLKKEIEVVRRIILGVSPAIREGIKWNAPSFRTSNYFATMHLRQDRVWLILHFGAKVKDNSKAAKINDPTGLLKWLAKDRALVTFADAKDVKAKRAALEEIIREWMGQERDFGEPDMRNSDSSQAKKPLPRTDVRSIVTELKRLSSEKYRDGMARYAIPTEKAFGVPVGAIQKLGKRLGRHHELAEALWQTGWYEARMLATFIDEPARLTSAQMDRWCRDFDSWAICDTACFHLFDRTPHAFRKVAQWSKRREEFVKRAAFALLASLALHDKKTADEPFARCLPLIERAATDERNFVKKGVVWALRGIGGRNLALNAAAVTVAQTSGGLDGCNVALGG